MSAREPRDVKEFRTEAELEEAASGNDVRKLDWEGEGYYAIYQYGQRCPRGCCYDSVYEARPIADHISDLEAHIEDLSSDLSHYKDLNHKYDLLAKYTKE